MSRNDALQILSRIQVQPAFVAETYASSFVQNVKELQSHGPKTEEDRKLVSASRIKELADAYGYTNAPQSKPYAYNDGVAVIPIHGSLVNRFSYGWSYITGYNYIRALLNAALEDDDVNLVVFDIDSGGGEALGCFELAEEIYAARERKPSLAVVDAVCCSAAYALGSSASKIVVTPSGLVGSIGVIAIHMSYAEMLKNDGVKVTIIKAGEHKADGNPYEDLSTAVLDRLQESVNKRRDEFVEVVVRNRDLTTEAVAGTDALVYRPDEAVELGLIDAVQTPTEAVSSYLAELGSGDDPEDQDEDDEMAAQASAPKTTAAAPVTDAADTETIRAEAQAQARQEERARINAILTAEDAKDRPKMAQYLAMETSRPLDEALRDLKAAAIETPPKVEAAPPAADDKGTPFRAAMDTGKNPQVPAEGEDDPAGKPKVSRAQAAMAMAGIIGAKKPAGKAH